MPWVFNKYSSRYSLLKLWTTLDESDIGDEAAATLIDEFYELLQRRQQDHQVQALKVSADEKCVVILYVIGNDIDADIMPLAEVLSEFANSKFVRVGFSSVSGSAVIKTVLPGIQ